MRVRVLCRNAKESLGRQGGIDRQRDVEDVHHRANNPEDT